MTKYFAGKYLACLISGLVAEGNVPIAVLAGKDGNGNLDKFNTRQLSEALRALGMDQAADEVLKQLPGIGGV